MTAGLATHGLSLNATCPGADTARGARKCLSNVEVRSRIAVWLQARFPEDDEAAARSLDVTPRTIRNWRAQASEPGGTSVVRIMMLDPAAAPYLTGETNDL